MTVDGVVSIEETVTAHAGDLRHGHTRRGRNFETKPHDFVESIEKADRQSESGLGDGYGK